MADRLSQYNMLPANFNQNLLQQQQQMSQQQPQVDNQTVDQRLWQQMQHRIIRSQNGGDMSGSQVNPQMVDLLRNHNMGRVSGQQQMGQSQQSQQQPFPQQIGSHNQQSPFSELPNQQGQTHMSPDFANLNVSQGQLQNRTAMFQALATTGKGGRQLDFLAMGPNQQQPQNGTPNFGPRMTQQQLQQSAQAAQGQSQGDMFSSPAISSAEGARNSPLHSASQAPVGMSTQPQPPQNPQGAPLARRNLTFPELRERVQQVQFLIVQQENAMLQLQNQRAAIPDAVFNNKMQIMANELKARKEFRAKLMSAMQATQNGASIVNTGMMSSNQQQSLAPTLNGQDQGSWGSQSGQSQAQMFANNQINGSTHPQAQSLTNPPGPSQVSAQANSMLGVPPRSGPTPHQLIPGQFPNRMSPNMANRFPFQANVPHPNPGGQQAANLQATVNMLPQIPPLDKSRFESAYSSFCTNQRLVHDPRLMSTDGRPIDLHSLHVQVMSAGGGQKVNQKELWSVIGGRMGFVHFLETDTEPAKSGPGVAQHLAHVYKEYLSAFDNVYVRSVIQSKRQMQEDQMHQNPAQTPATNQGQLNLGLQGQPSAARAIPTPQQMQAVMAYANLSVAELRAKGVSEKIIQFVEQNRANLKRTEQQQDDFRGMLAKRTQLAGPVPFSNQDRGSSSNGPGPFNNVMPQQNAGTSHPSQYPPGMSNHPNLNLQYRQTQPPIANGGGPSSQPQPNRPTHEQLLQAHQFVLRVKQDFVTRNIPHMPLQVVPVEQRMEYQRVLEQLCRSLTEMEPKLPMFCLVLKQEDFLKKLIAINITVHQQRNFLNSDNPKFIVDLTMLHNMGHQIQRANEMFATFVSMMNGQQQANNGNSNNGSQGPTNPQNRLPACHPHPQPSPQPTNHVVSTPSNHAVSLTQPPLRKKPHTAGSTAAAVSTPTPPPSTSVSTPVPNAPTPTPAAASSPPAPRSPKTKLTGKPRAAAPTRRKVSKPNVESPAPHPSEPASVKRSRDEEAPISNPTAVTHPSPKRVKTEWEGPPDEVVVKRQEEVENIKTEEDASAFFERVTEFLKRAADDQGQQESMRDISQTLDMILKGYSSVPDAGDIASSSSLLSLGDMGVHKDLSPPRKPPADEFVEFFDFSSFGAQDDEDSTSKAPTPDLVSSSSTNPSPGSEADTAGHITALDIKTEDLLDLSLGAWKEIDGGESAYYQSDNWKWDAAMPTLEQPWAIFNTS